MKRQDSAEVLEVFDQAWGNPPTFAASILREVSLWGQDLSQVPGLTEAIDAQLHQLQSPDSRAALQQLVRSEA
ncbi:altronate oxidoreductase [compost metagenome]